jgi:hypothetical protein
MEKILQGLHKDNNNNEDTTFTIFSDSDDQQICVCVSDFDWHEIDFGIEVDNIYNEIFNDKDTVITFYNEEIFKDYINWMNCELNVRNVRTLWSSWSKESYNLLQEVIERDNIIPFFDVVDYGRDGIHPGKVSHINFAKNIVGSLKNENS